MKALQDYFTLICFFAAYAITRSIYTATAIGMGSAVLQYLFMLIKERSFSKVRMLSFITVLWLIFGSLTLYFHDPRFIQWKPSILYWGLAVILLGSHFIGTRTIYEILLGDKVILPGNVYRFLNASWVVFFAALGVLNIIIAYHTSMTFWVYYKIFGTLALTFLFVIWQALIMSKYMQQLPGTSATASATNMENIINTERTAPTEPSNQQAGKPTHQQDATQPTNNDNDNNQTGKE